MLRSFAFWLSGHKLTNFQSLFQSPVSKVMTSLPRTAAETIVLALMLRRSAPSFTIENRGQPVITAPASMELKVVGLKAVMKVPLEFVNGTNWSPASTALHKLTSGHHQAVDASGKA